MKKIVPIVIIFLLFVTGCGSNEEELVLPERFSFMADIEYKELSFSCEVIKNGESDYNIKVVDSGLLNGFALNIKGEESTLSYMGVDIDIATKIIPTEMPFLILTALLDYLSSESCILFSDDGKSFSMEGNIELGDFSLKTDENKETLTIEIKSHEFSTKIYHINAIN